jgi:alpha(1,3/1,4) fucosyltransferase
MNIFALTDINYTPFHFAAEDLGAGGFQITDRIDRADILVGKFLSKQNVLRGVKFRRIYGNKTPLLIWSAEPRDFPITTPLIARDILYPEIHVMNMYTSGVYRSPGSFYGFQARPTEYMSDRELKNKSGIGVSVMKYIPSPNSFSIDRKNVDLLRIRQELTILGHQKGLVDIHGRDWPAGFSKSSSGHQPTWANEKLEILNKYKFNICLENTAYPLYISEKIWHSIMGKCLPIYSSYNSSIYEVFPKNSFLDLLDFENTEDLFEYMRNMSDREYLDRFNLCVDTMNEFCKNYNLDFEHKWIGDRLLDKLQFIQSKIG